MKKYRLQLLFLVTFLNSCTNHNIYKNIEDKSYIGKIHTFRLLTTSPDLLELSKKAIKDTNIKLSKSPYTIIIESSKYPSHCNNPLNISNEARFDGYIKITLKKGFHKIYTIQADFYDDIDKKLIQNLLNQMQKDLKI